MKNEYDDFVEHPRYRRAPRITGLNSQTDLATGQTYLHWNATTRIPNTVGGRRPGNGGLLRGVD
jgi:hypothetical protein